MPKEPQVTCKHCNAPKAENGAIPIYVHLRTYPEGGADMLGAYIIEDDAQAAHSNLADKGLYHEVQKVSLHGPGLPIRKMLAQGQVTFVPPGFYTKSELLDIIKESFK